MGRAFVRADFSEPLALARLACAVGDDAPQAEVCSAVLELLDLFDEHLAPPEEGRPIPRRRAPARVRADRRPHARRAAPGAARPPHPTRAEAELHEPKGGPRGLGTTAGTTRRRGPSLGRTSSAVVDSAGRRLEPAHDASPNSSRNASAVSRKPIRGVR